MIASSTSLVRMPVKILHDVVSFVRKNNDDGVMENDDGERSIVAQMYSQRFMLFSILIDCEAYNRARGHPRYCQIVITACLFRQLAMRHSIYQAEALFIVH